MSEVIALFETRMQAKRAWEDLRDLGFRPDGVGMIQREDEEVPGGEEARKGAAGGAMGGAAVGAGTGLLASAGVMVLPGVGPILAAGTVAATLAGAGAGAVAGTALGGVLGAVHGSSSDDETAARYRTGLDEGGVLVTVEAPAERFAEAKQILILNGAEKVDIYDEGWTT